MGRQLHYSASSTTAEVMRTTNHCSRGLTGAYWFCSYSYALLTTTERVYIMNIFVVHTQHLENYGAHAENGKHADGNAYWKFKGGDTYFVEGTERV